MSAGVPLSGDPLIDDPWSPLAKAVWRYLEGDDDAHAEVVHEDGTRSRLDARTLVRDDGFPDLETMALTLASGRVLDVGAGAGPHALELQDRGFAVTAIDISPSAVALMQRRGIEDARQCDVIGDAGMSGAAVSGTDILDGERFDTVLMLMNGLGVAGDLAQLGPLLDRLLVLLEPGGIVLADGADLAFSDDPDALARVTAREASGRYRGEARCRLAVPDGQPGSEYGWLFVDPATLQAQAEQRGWRCQIVFSDGEGGFLARLVPRSFESTGR